MRPGVAAAICLVCVAACATSSSVAAPTPPPVEARAPALDAFSGSYSMADGDTIVIARLGWFFDMRSADYRTIYATAAPNHFTIGSAFREPLPRFAELNFASDQLTVRAGSGTRTGHRIAYRCTDVNVPVAGASLAAEITEPLGAGPHPGVVIVHGAERGERSFYDVWVGIYASLGLTVLTYDKRGVGASTGQYPGDSPTPAALHVYADDASAVLESLRRWPGVDGRRVGFHGGSQGGWTVPLAMQRHAGAAFAILVSAPATTVDQTDLWASFSGGGSSLPSDSNETMLAQVRDTHSGYDPRPALLAIQVPTIWILGTNDRTVPTAVCVEVIDSLHKPNFSVHLVPTGHGLLANATGLVRDDDRSPGLAPDLVSTLAGWFKASSSSS